LKRLAVAKRGEPWFAVYREYLQTPHWKYVRAKALRAANHQCCRCHKERAFPVHHLSYKHLGQETPEDLQALCGNCHLAAHGKKEKPVANKKQKKVKRTKRGKRNRPLSISLKKRKPRLKRIGTKDERREQVRLLGWPRWSAMSRLEKGRAIKETQKLPLDVRVKRYLAGGPVRGLSA